MSDWSPVFSDPLSVGDKTVFRGGSVMGGEPDLEPGIDIEEANPLRCMGVEAPEWGWDAAGSVALAGGERCMGVMPNARRTE